MSHVRLCLIAAACSAVLAAAPSAGAVRRVPQDHATITAALAAAMDGDSVIVAPGRYAPSTNGETFPIVVSRSGLKLLGAGMSVTTLDAENTAGVLRHEAAVGGRISGFRITGGRTSQGGGIRVEQGNVEIDHNKIDHNGASQGGAGISMQNAVAPWIHHNLITENFATSTADVHGLRYNLNSGGVFEHNLLAHSDGNGLLTVDDAAPSIRHNIFYKNGVPSPLRGRGICWLSNPAATIFHNLFFQNQVAALLWQGGGGDFSGAAANAFDPLDHVYGNLDADPLFVNEAQGDYRLKPTSPAIDAGDPALPHDPDNSIADIGPFVFTNIASVPPAPGGDIALSASPNPAPAGVDIRFALPAPDRVRIDVLDLSGRLVRSLEDGSREAGPHVVRWDGADVRGQRIPGAYYVRLRSGAASRTLGLVLIR